LLRSPDANEKKAQSAIAATCWHNKYYVRRHRLGVLCTIGSGGIGSPMHAFLFAVTICLDAIPIFIGKVKKQRQVRLRALFVPSAFAETIPSHIEI